MRNSKSVIKTVFSISSFLLVTMITWVTYRATTGNFIGGPFLVLFIFLPTLFLQAMFMFIYLTNKNEKNLWVQFGLAFICLAFFIYYVMNNSSGW